MSGGRFTGHGGEAGERTLFVRRARALPAAEVPSLEAVLAAAAASGSVGSPRGPARGSVAIIGVAVLAAACVGGLVVGSARAAGDLGGKSVAATDFDAGVAATTALGQASGGTCEPDDESVSCEAPPASFVVASSDPTSQTWMEPESSPRLEPAPLASERELVCMP